MRVVCPRLLCIIDLWIKFRLIHKQAGYDEASPVVRGRGLSNKGHSSSLPLVLCTLVPCAGGGASLQHLEPLEPLSNYPRIGRVNGTARPFKGREFTARIQLRNIVAAVPRRSIRDPRRQRTETIDEAEGKEREGGGEEPLVNSFEPSIPPIPTRMYGPSQMRITRISRCPDSICLRGCRSALSAVRSRFLGDTTIILRVE